MAYSNYLCSVKPAVGREQNNLKGKIETEMFLYRQKRTAEFFIPGIQRQRSEELREDSVNAHNGFSPFSLCLAIGKKCNVMAQIVSVFLKTKGTGKWGTKCNADGNYGEKSTPPMKLGRATDSLPCLLYCDLRLAMVLVTLVKPL